MQRSDKDKPEGAPAKGAPQKAYRDLDFLESAPARSLRILSEYVEPDARFKHYKIDDTIIFFGSARILPREEAERRLEEARSKGDDLTVAQRNLDMSRYYEDTRELARRLTEWSKSLQQDDRRFVVCSGGGPGIMEAANRGASEAKGLNIGLNISLPMEQIDNPYISRELNFEFHYFFMRKFWFLYLAKAVLVFPGGFGTLDELFEILTMVQTRKMRKRLPIVLFGTDYWDRIVDFDELARHGTIDARDVELMHRTDSIDDAFEFVTGELLEYNLDAPGARL